MAAGTMTHSHCHSVKAIVALGLQLLLGLASCSRGPTVMNPDEQTVVIAGRTFHLELALDGAARAQGLSDRKEIAGDGGMLFVFREAEYLTFVMRRCLVPIDIIFLDSDCRIVAIHAMTVEPYERTDAELTPYESRQPAQFAIEVKGGTIARLGLKLGEKINMPAESLKSRSR